MLGALKNLIGDESGATLVEYGLLIALVAVAAISSMTFLDGKIQAVFSNTGNDL